MNFKLIRREFFRFFWIVVFGFSPIIVAVGSGYIATLFGYHITEAGPPDDSALGSLFYTLGVLGWLFIITLPVAAVMFIAYAIYVIAREVVKHKNPNTISNPVETQQSYKPNNEHKIVDRSDR